MKEILEEVINNIIRLLVLSICFWYGKYLMENSIKRYNYKIVFFSLGFAFYGYAFQKPIGGSAISSSITCIILFLTGTFVGYQKTKSDN